MPGLHTDTERPSLISLAVTVTSYMEGSQPFIYRCAPRGTRTGHCPTGISKSIISNDYKNEEAGQGPVPKDIQTRSLFLQQCNSFVKIIQDSIESRI